MQIHPIEEYNSKHTMDNYHKPCKYMNQVRGDQLSLESLGIGCKNLWRHLLFLRIPEQVLPHLR